MSEYPDIPYPSTTSQGPATWGATAYPQSLGALDRLPSPAAYDHRTYAPDSPDAAPLVDNVDFVVFAIEATTRNGTNWQLRPHHEFRGGRAFGAHYQRLRRISGFWHSGALVFSDVGPAHTAVGALTEANPGHDFRVVEIRVIRTRRIITPKFGPNRDAAVERLAGLVATQGEGSALPAEMRRILAEIARDLGGSVPSLPSSAGQN